jgi:CRP/FNR family cyclic AMP-dependent transcriptional regulator
VQTERAAELLAQTRLFRDLPPEESAGIAARTVERTYRKGQLIFGEGDDANSLFVMISGLIKVFVTSEDGDEMGLVTLRPPDVFGEIALIDGQPRSASAEAVEPSRVLELGRSTLMELVSSSPSITDSLLVSLGGVLRRLTEHAADLVFLDLHGRVAKLLVGMVDEGDHPGDGVVELDLELTQSDLASMVGGSRQSVNQILGSFARRGYLDMKGRKVVIKNLAGLRRRAGQ